MMLTLFADASYCPKTKAAGWGAWAIRDGWDRGRFMGGPLRRPFKTTNAVELCGIASALYELEQDGSLKDVTRLIIQCDNVAALGAILRHVPGSKLASRKGDSDTNNIPTVRWSRCEPVSRIAIEHIRAAKKGRELYVRHVKGHQSDVTGRAWVNEQCDAEAKRHMRNVRKELQAVTHFEVIV